MPKPQRSQATPPRAPVAHRDGSLAASDRRPKRGIPYTTIERTLLDLAAIAPLEELREAVGAAEGLRKLDRRRARALIRRYRGRRGVARLRMGLDEVHPESKRTRSELERMFLRLSVRAGLPQPAVNALVEVEDGMLEVDFLWPSNRFAVEADSRRHHDTDTAYRRDRRRDQELQLAGWRVARCTWEEVEDEPRALGLRLRDLLATT